MAKGGQMQRLFCCQDEEMAGKVEVEDGARLLGEEVSAREGMVSEGEVQREMESLQREVEASKATVIAMDKRRKAELEKAEERRRSELQVVEERRRKEKEELETEVVKLRRRLEDVEIPFKEEVNLNLDNLVKNNVNCSR